MENIENIINRIIDIEKRAQNTIRETSDQRDKMPEEVAARLKELREQYEEIFRERMEKVIEEEALSTKRRIEKIDADHKARLEKLLEVSDEHVEEWIEMIYSDIVSFTRLKG